MAGYASLGKVSLFCHLLLLASGACLPSAVPPSQRKNLTDAVGNSYPIGFLLGGWTSAQVTAAAFEILLEEALGYNTVVHPQVLPGTFEAIYALLGCQDFLNLADRGCENRQIRHHIFTDSWITLYAHVLDDLAKSFKAEVPRRGGSMGYSGLDGMYVPGRAQSVAQASAGLALEYYKSWNASWYEPWHFFDSISALNASAVLKPCNESFFTENSTIYRYYMLTGDADGVIVNGTSYIARCDDGYWWLSPACRSAPQTCVPYITYNGWYLQATMQKAAAFNMPLAEAVVLSEELYASIPQRFTTMFYWWEPDDTFVSLDASIVVFPRFSRQARQRFDYTSSSEEIDVVKMVSHDLELLAPYVSEFLQKSLFELSNIRSFISSVGPNSSRYDVACRWLHQSRDVWESWLPDRTVCTSGFGLFNDLREEYVGDREDSQHLSCRPCPIGTFSEQIADSAGVTFRCADCPAGFRQPSAAASFCLPCAPGTSKSEPSREECTPCTFGSFQDQSGAQRCQPCPDGTTTLGLGTYSPAACGCLRGTIEVARSGLNVSCVPCERGLDCPSLATLGGLTSGLSPTGEVPHILPGFMSPDREALSIFRCGQPAHCPGGFPGRCAGGRVADQVCATCPRGWRWAESSCVQCEVWLVVLWAAVSVAVLLLLPLAGRRRPEVAMSVVRDLHFTLQELAFIALQSLQVFAIIRQITVEWPSSRTDFILSLMLLNVSDLGISCIVGSQRAEYLLQAGFLPVGCAWCCFCILVASRICEPELSLGSALVRSINTVGLISFVFFEMACNMALAPFTCYVHPNGKHSIRQYPSVLCDTTDHAIMAMAGGGLVVLLVAFLAVSAWAVWCMPYWTLRKEMRGRVAAFRFVKEGYRLDSWWYGVPVLLTGPLLSLPGVLATDDPATQVALTTLILFAHLLLLLLSWPWKVPVVNVIETVAVSGALFSAISAGLFLPAGAGSSFSSFFSLLARLVVAGAFFVVVVMFTWGMIECTCYGRTRRFVWMDLARPRDTTRLIDGLFSIVDALVEMEEEHLKQRLSMMQPFDQNLLQSCISMLSLEVIPHESFRLSMQMRATTRIRSSYRTCYSLDKLATLAMGEDEETGQDLREVLGPVAVEDGEGEATAAAEGVEEAPPSTGARSDSNSKTKTCHVSFSPSPTSTPDDEDSDARPEVFREEL